METDDGISFDAPPKTHPVFGPYRVFGENTDKHRSKHRAYGWTLLSLSRKHKCYIWTFYNLWENTDHINESFRVFLRKQIHK